MNIMIKVNIVNNKKGLKMTKSKSKKGRKLEIE